MPPANPSPPAGIYVFDAYGTLLDVHAAISAHRDAVGPDAQRCSEIWRAKQLEYSWTTTLAGDYTDFWTLTERALDYALALCPSIDRAMRARLLESYMTLGAYADAQPLLGKLKAQGARTAILSNGSPAMLKAACDAAMLTPLLDVVLSVDALRMFKPRAPVYQMACDFFGARPDAITFVSSNRWDVMGASRFGFSTSWINRAGLPDEYPDHPPAHVITTLAAIV